MQLILPEVLPRTLSPTGAQRAGLPVEAGVLSQTAVIGSEVQRALPELSVLNSPAIGRASIPVARSEGGQGVRGGGTLTPEAANLLGSSFRQLGESIASAAPGMQGATRQDQAPANPTAPTHRTEETQFIPPAEQPVAEALANSVVPEGAFSMERAPLIEEVGNRRFGPQQHPIRGGIRQHNGIDIGADYNTPILAPTDGVVSSVDWWGGGGHRVVVDHGDGYETWYMHLQPTGLPQVGQQLAAGDQLALVGSTGLSTGPHLHFELRLNGEAVDPMPFWVNSLAPEQRVQYENDRDVRAHQRVLAQAGFYRGEIDGDFGPLSQNAYRQFVDSVTSQDILGINRPRAARGGGGRVQ